MKTTAIWSILAIFPLLISSGCGGDGRPDLVPVEGTVTIDGEPAEGVQVFFQVVEVADGGEYNRPSSGVTDAQGKFRIGTYGADDGMPLGSYKIGLMKKELIGELPEDYNSEMPEASGRPIRYQWHTPEELADPSTSGLTAEVTSDGLVPDTFDVEGGGRVEVIGGGPRAGEP